MAVNISRLILRNWLKDSSLLKAHKIERKKTIDIEDVYWEIHYKFIATAKNIAGNAENVLLGHPDVDKCNDVSRYGKKEAGTGEHSDTLIIK